MKNKSKEKSSSQRRREKMAKVVGISVAAVMLLTLMMPVFGM